MLPFIMLVIGLVAAILEEQVGGQHTVGVILAVIGGVLFVIQMIVTAIVAKKVTDAHDRVRRGFR